MIDWSLATQLAGLVAGDPGHRPRPGLPEVAVESERLVSGYTGLRPAQPLPTAELLDRPEWIDANLRSMRPLLEPLTERLGDSLGPLAPALRATAGTLVAAELGVLMGFVARRVLGQYELVLLDAEAPARLLFVGPNLDEAASFMRARDDDLLTWVALHEVTHALQFAGVPWLRAHMAGLVRSLLQSMEVALDPSRLMRVPSRDDVRALADAIAAGDLLSLVTGPRERELIDRVQAAMAVLEGYAEHVMDVVGRPLLPSLPSLREAMTRRRTTQSPIARLFARLLGLELKMRQYELGKRFCDAVVEEDGIEALNRVWSGPEALPDLHELEQPGGWVARTRVPSVTKPQG